MPAFIDDDRGVIAWKESNPIGYVLNTTRKPRADYLMLHPGKCSHLSWENADVHWTKDYIKICSTEIKEINDWIRGNVPGQPQITRCRTCNP